MDIISYCADICTGGIIPINLLVKGFNLLKEKYVLNHSYYKEYLNQLGNVEAEEIYSCIPCYLGLEIDYSYESIGKKFNERVKSNIMEECIQEFIAS